MTPSAGKVIVLTGAANGIGRATAEALAARGERLGLIDRDAKRLDQLMRQLEAFSANLSAHSADVADSASVKSAVASIESKLGPTDVLVACAGVGSLTNVPNLDTAALQQMLMINVVGVAHAIDAVLPGMIERHQGHIVGISSVAGFRGMPWMASYSASKAALWAYLEGIRPALKRRGIRISTVFPGFVGTGMTLDVPFARPVSMLKPEQAAAHLVKVIQKRPRDYVFPLTAAVGMGLLRRTPNALFDWMMDQAGPKALTTEF